MKSEQSGTFQITQRILSDVELPRTSTIHTLRTDLNKSRQQGHTEDD